MVFLRFPLEQKSQIPDPSTAAPLEAEADPERLKRYAEFGLKPTPVQKTQPYSSLHPDARGYTPAYLLPGSGGGSPAAPSPMSHGSRPTELTGRTSTHKSTEEKSQSEGPGDYAPGQGGAVGGYKQAPSGQTQGTTTAAVGQGRAEGTARAQVTSDQTSSMTTLATAPSGAAGRASAAQAGMAAPSGTGRAGPVGTDSEQGQKTAPALPQSVSKVVGVDSNTANMGPVQTSGNAAGSGTQATAGTDLNTLKRSLIAI